MSQKLETLIRLMGEALHSDPEICYRACRGLQAMGKDAVGALPVLDRVLFNGREYCDKSDRNRYVTYRMSEVAFEAMCAIDVPAAFKILSQDTNSTNLKFLARLPGCEKQAQPILLKALESSNAYEREAAIQGFQHFKKPPAKVIAHHIALLKKKDPKDVYYAIEALSTFGPAAKAAIPALKALLTSSVVYSERFANDVPDFYEISTCAQEALKRIDPALKTQDS